MSQQDLRATIRDVQTDASLTQEEKSRKIQEIMSFSWRKSQQHLQSVNSMRKRTASQKSMRRFRSATALGRRDSSSSTHTLGSHGTRPGAQDADGALSGIDFESVDDEDTEADSGEEDDDGDFDNDPIMTFHDEPNNIHGCKHYQRRCHVAAPCCKEFFCCRFCHDEMSDHEIDRAEINKVRCMMCGHKQDVAAECENCNQSFARYFCSECKFFDDKDDKKIYHCEKCKICRIGEGLGIDYFHCDRCNACMSITLKDHKCVERSLESDCPVCSEYLFTSTIPVMFLPCGHCIHVKCYETYTQTNFTCPLCCKSLGDMSQYFMRIDQLLASEQMPEEYKGLRSLIFCSDCEQRSIASFHFVYHKCGDCGSYNTKVLEQLPREEDEAAEPAATLPPPAPSSQQPSPVDGAQDIVSADDQLRL